MNLTDAQLQELSQLVDTMEALPPEARGRWLASLTQEQAIYRPTLERFMRPADGMETRDFLATLPKFDSEAPPDSGEISAGQEIGPYQLLRELGRGGMGSVWLAQRSDGLLKRTVALKLPHSALPQRQLALRLARERDILARLAHPNIARLYDAGISPQGRPYLALEYVEGEPLLAWCDGRELRIEARIALFLQVLAAVQYAHGQLVVHRDLKPSNILVTHEGEVRLLDFGIAKILTDGEARETELTRLGGRALTPQYASPEQIAGQPLGTASDVYALGVVLYELLTGVLPYRVKRDSRGALEDAILAADVARPSQAVGDPAHAKARGTTAKRLAHDLRGDLDTIVPKALKKNPQERYATADALASDLTRHLAGEPVLATPDSTWYRTRKFVGRNRLAVGAATSVVIALGAGLGVALWQAGIAREQAALAREEAQSTKAVHDFLADIFTANSSNQSDPLKARQTTARELLDIGAAKIDSSLKGSPEAKAAVLRLVSDMYSELGLSDRAVDLARQRVDLLRTLRGPDHPDVADQLTEVSMMLQSTNRAGERGPLLRDALRILDLHPGESTKTRIRVLRQLALLEHEARAPEAKVHVREAVSLSESIRANKDLAEALMVEGVILSAWGEHAGAEKALTRAAATADAAPDFHRRQRILLIAYLGDEQIALGKYAAAEGSFREGLDLALRLSGPDHIDAAQMEYRLGQVLFESARTREGQKLIESARARVIRIKGSNDTSFLPRLLRVEGSMSVVLGNPEVALANAESALRLLAGGGRGRYVANLLLLQAEAAMELGRVDDAKSALAKFDSEDGAGKAIDVDEREHRKILGARASLIEGRRDQAQGVLAQERAALSRERRSPVEWRRLLQWGDLALDVGEGDTALAVAEDVLTRIRADPAPGRLELREYFAADLAGRARLAKGEIDAAISDLRRAVALGEAHLDPASSPRLADSLVALAEATRRAGRNGEAREYAARAHAIIARHPKLSDPHQKHLREVERHLAGRPADRPRHAASIFISGETA